MNTYAGLTTKHKKSNEYSRTLVSVLKYEFNIIFDAQDKKVTDLSSSKKILATLWKSHITIIHIPNIESAQNKMVLSLKFQFVHIFWRKLLTEAWTWEKGIWAWKWKIKDWNMLIPTEKR